MCNLRYVSLTFKLSTILDKALTGGVKMSANLLWVCSSTTCILLSRVLDSSCQAHGLVRCAQSCAFTDTNSLT